MFDIKENLKKLPDCPGVYLHKDRLGQVIYVGKAVSLRNRVRQYFQSAAKTNPKVRALVSNIAEFEYITCSTEMEALILECNLIKKYMPKYNVFAAGRQDLPLYQGHCFRGVSPGHQDQNDCERRQSRYFGPYSDSGAVNRIVELLSGIYSLKRCGAQTFPAGHRPCLNYHINQCRGVCAGKVSRKEYMESIEKVLEFLGEKKNLCLKVSRKKCRRLLKNCILKRSQNTETILFPSRQFRKPSGLL